MKNYTAGSQFPGDFLLRSHFLLSVIFIAVELCNPKENTRTTF